MIKFDIGDRVIVIEDNEVKKGTIKKIFYELHTFIVEFDDGNVGKVSDRNIAPEPKAETTAESEAQEKREDVPRMKSEVTITPREFREISTRVLAEKTAGRMIVGVAFIPILTAIHEALFCDKESENSDNDE
jgi:hypothetical protein